MDIDNFVYYQKGGKVMRFGYEVDCKMINNDLSVPAGLFILNKSIHSNTKNVNELFDNLDVENDVISEDLYDNLLGLMDPSKKKRTLKKKIKKHKTRRKGKSKQNTRRKTRSLRK